MPAGLPSAVELMEERSIGFFSMDTNIIQSHGYKFREGALHALALQRPSWISLQLTELVQKEIMSHRMEALLKADQELKTSLEKLQRITGQDLSAISRSFSDLNIERQGVQKFEEAFSGFLRKFDGGVLPIEGPELARQMFYRYFNLQPPFEERKKTEFPDAAALLVLEAHAMRHRQKGILISNDKGWVSFAEKSDHLYCVRSIEDFAKLFASKGERAELVLKKVRSALDNSQSAISSTLDLDFGNHVEGAFWDVRDPGSNFNVRAEAQLESIEYVGYKIDKRRLSLWFAEHDPSMCVIEINAAIKARLNIEVSFYAYDPFDDDEMSVGSPEFEEEKEVNVEAFLICRGDLINDDADEWEVSVEISGGEYSVDLGIVDPETYDED